MPEPRHVIKVRDTVNPYNYGHFQFEALCDCGRSSLQPSLLDASEWAKQHIMGFTLETPVSKAIPDGNILMWAAPSDIPPEPTQPIAEPPKPPVAGTAPPDPAMPPKPPEAPKPGQKPEHDLPGGPGKPDKPEHDKPGKPEHEKPEHKEKEHDKKEHRRDA